MSESHNPFEISLEVTMFDYGKEFAIVIQLVGLMTELSYENSSSHFGSPRPPDEGGVERVRPKRAIPYCVRPS